MAETVTRGHTYCVDPRITGLQPTRCNHALAHMQPAKVVVSVVPVLRRVCIHDRQHFCEIAGTAPRTMIAAGLFWALYEYI